MKTIGIIGLGAIGMRHARNLIAMGHAVRGYDPAERPIGEFGIDWVESPRDLEGVDGFIISSPPYRHVDDLYYTLGQPTLIEKPIATTEYDYAVMMENSRHYLPFNNVYVGCNQRFHPCVQEAKRDIGYGAIGEVISASFVVAQKTEKPPYLRDGVTLNWGAHEVDLALFLLGPGKMEQPCINKEDTVAWIRISHQGVPSAVFMDYLTETPHRSFKIDGTKGSIFANLERFEYYTTYGNSAKIETLPGSMDQTYVDEMQAFILASDGYLSPWLATGNDGLAVLRIILDAKFTRNGQAAIEWMLRP